MSSGLCEQSVQGDAEYRNLEDLDKQWGIKVCLCSLGISKALNCMHARTRELLHQCAFKDDDVLEPISPLTHALPFPCVPPLTAVLVVYFAGVVYSSATYPVSSPADTRRTYMMSLGGQEEPHACQAQLPR